MDWEQILTVFAVIATNLGTVITLYCQMDRKLDDHRKETTLILQGIHQEMKEFHGRLERQDAEFKGRLEKQDAEFKGRLALQDAEFKHHMMFEHSQNKKS